MAECNLRGDINFGEKPLLERRPLQTSHNAGLAADTNGPLSWKLWPLIAPGQMNWLCIVTASNTSWSFSYKPLPDIASLYLKLTFLAVGLPNTGLK